MMKTIGILVLVVAGTSVQAELIERTWTSQSIYAHAWPGDPNNKPLSIPALPMPDEGDGIGWQIDIALAGSFPGGFPPLDANAGTAKNYGWYDGYGFYIGGFNFTAFEGESVIMRMFNATTMGAATAYMESYPVLLPDIEGAPAPGVFDVTFEFETIPEPSTIGLMGIAGLGMFLTRKKIRR